MSLRPARRSGSSPPSSRSAMSPVSSQPSANAAAVASDRASSPGRRWGRGRRARRRGAVEEGARLEVAQGDVDVRVGRASEAELPPRVLGGQAEDVRRGLGEPVALDDLDAALLPRLEQALRHGGATDDGEPQARESALGERRILRHEEVRRRDAHHRRHPLSRRSAERRAGIEGRLEHDRGALPPGEQGTGRSSRRCGTAEHLQHDVVGRGGSSCGRRRGSSRSCSRA